MTPTPAPALRRGRRALLLAGLLGAAVAAGGCGYALVGRASNLPADVRNVYLKPFTNSTQRTQVDQIITQAVANELVTRHRFNVTNTPDAADAILSGSVLAAGLTPVSFDTNGRATEYEISIVVKVDFRRKPTTPNDPGAAIWTSDRYVFRENYPVEISETGFFDTETIAITEASSRFAETMVSDLLEGF